MENRDVFNITWQGIEIEITCSKPAYLSSYRKIYGYEMLHIEVRSTLPLSITETGYKSIFVTEPELAGRSGSLKYVTSFIDAEEKSKKWRNSLENSRQFNLF